ncbi:MAG: NAD-dependent epimerase/dehydratase family protein [Bacteroidetes bacterium]|nr:NAD-dependent epimerase/dehydratase family protein [Bacteroidota bacterium]MBU2585679.1 NAD-dependent epimerase/dehydratase family protein [Bacteroidota bacterium]
MKKVLITGASGYLGTHLCNEFSKISFKTVGLFKTNKPSVKNIEFVQNEISDAIELRRLFEFHRFDLVYHLAAVTPVDSIDSSEDYIRKIKKKKINRYF